MDPLGGNMDFLGCGSVVCPRDGSVHPRAGGIMNPSVI